MPPTPDTTEEAAPELRLPDAQTTALILLATFALIYTLNVARAFFLPLVLATLLNILLSPLVRLLGRLRLPAPAAAAVIMLLLIGGVGVAGYNLADPVQTWITKAPQTLSEARSKIKKISKPVEQVNRAAAQVENATQPAGSAQTPQVVVRTSSLSERIFGTTQSLVIGLFEVLVLTYFLLAAGDLFLHKLVYVLPGLADKKKAVFIAREIEKSVSRYLGTVTLVNLCLGAVVAVVMMLVGMPNPILWGVAAGLLEYIPYVGAATMTAILTLAALTNFDDPGRALVVPGVYVLVNATQANLITPIVMGKRLTLNPVAIFVGLMFWSLLWGVTGAFLAVPLLASMKIFCDHIERLKPMGEFLGR